MLVQVQRGHGRCILNHFGTFGARREWVVNATLWPLYPRKRPLYRRLAGPWGWSGQARKVSPWSEFNPGTVQLAAGRRTVRVNMLSRWQNRWALGLVWTGTESLALIRIQPRDCPTCSKSLYCPCRWQKFWGLLLHEKRNILLIWVACCCGIFVFRMHIVNDRTHLFQGCAQWTCRFMHFIINLFFLCVFVFEGTRPIWTGWSPGFRPWQSSSSL